MRSPSTNGSSLDQRREFLWRERVRLELQVQALLARGENLARQWQHLQERKAALGNQLPRVAARWSLLVWWESASFPLKGCILTKRSVSLRKNTASSKTSCAAMAKQPDSMRRSRYLISSCPSYERRTITVVALQAHPMVNSRTYVTSNLPTSCSPHRHSLPFLSIYSSSQSHEHCSTSSCQHMAHRLRKQCGLLCRAQERLHPNAPALVFREATGLPSCFCHAAKQSTCLLCGHIERRSFYHEHHGDCTHTDTPGRCPGVLHYSLSPDRLACHLSM